MKSFRAYASNAANCFQISRLSYSPSRFLGQLSDCVFWVDLLNLQSVAIYRYKPDYFNQSQWRNWLLRSALTRIDGGSIPGVISNYSKIGHQTVTNDPDVKYFIPIALNACLT